MYESFYGFSALPFSLLPDADFLFPSKRHRRAINLLEYGISTQAGFIVITGDVGAGKTTILRRFIKNAGKDIVVGVINNPSKSLGTLLNWIALAFDLDERSQDSAKLYHRFVEFLVAQYANGKRTVLIFDEAQNLDVDALEELRMLSNVNNEKDQLLQMVLVGQPELLETLNLPELRQFAQRIAVHSHLDPLSPGETAAYIHHRLGIVGGSPEIFDDAACAAVYYFTRGVPRLINLICDQALVYSFSMDEPVVHSQVIAEVAMDRQHSGLSAFRTLPRGWDIESLPEEIAGTIKKINLARKRGEI